METGVLVVMADWVAVSKLHAQQKLEMVELAALAVLAAPAETEAMAQME